MRHRAFLILVALLAAATVATAIFQNLDDGFAERLDALRSDFAMGIERIRTQEHFPPPLRREQGALGALTVSGTLRETNRHRETEGRPALVQNARLEAAAEAKARDMLDRQYFAHVAPDGTGPSDLIEEAGYAYISTGENLALGAFADDADLVQAWMDSPGHRENILNADFKEIGIAVMRGTFEGDEVWVAVQAFGRPLSDCPAPDPALRGHIDREEAELRELVALAETKREELESSDPRTPRERAEHNRKVREYNELVDIINARAADLESSIALYNAQVDAFNACAGN